jgi:hypothetical protein
MDRNIIYYPEKSRQTSSSDAHPERCATRDEHQDSKTNKFIKRGINKEEIRRFRQK